MRLRCPRCSTEIEAVPGHTAACPTCAYTAVAPGGPTAVAQPRLRTNGLAVAALVVGIIGVCGWGVPIGGFILPILALVFGLVGRAQIKAKGEAGDGMAIAGIVLGAVGLAAAFLGMLVFFGPWFMT